MILSIKQLSRLRMRAWGGRKQGRREEGMVGRMGGGRKERKRGKGKGERKRRKRNRERRREKERSKGKKFEFRSLS